MKKTATGTNNSANQVTVEKLQPDGEVLVARQFAQGEIEDAYLFNFQLYGREASRAIIEKFEKHGRPLSEFVSFVYGFKTGDDDQFIHSERKYKECKPFIRSAAVQRYSHESPDEYVWYVPERMIKNRNTARPGETARFESEKVIVARMGKALIATYDAGGLYVKDAMLLLSKDKDHSLKYLLGVINSRLLTYFYQEFFVTIDVLKNALLSLPIRPINFADPADKARHDKMVALVERMLELHKQKAAATGETAQARLDREINIADEHIDALVYELYGLTEEEVKVVEVK